MPSLSAKGSLRSFATISGMRSGRSAEKLLEVAQDRRQAGGEEKREDEEDGEDEDDDGDCARGLVVADFDLCDAVDGRHENDGEESADVEDQELFLKGLGEGQEQARRRWRRGCSRGRGRGIGARGV